MGILLPRPLRQLSREETRSDQPERKKPGRKEAEVTRPVHEAAPDPGASQTAGAAAKAVSALVMDDLKTILPGHASPAPAPARMAALEKARRQFDEVVNIRLPRLERREKIGAFVSFGFLLGTPVAGLAFVGGPAGIVFVLPGLALTVLATTITDTEFGPAKRRSLRTCALGDYENQLAEVAGELANEHPDHETMTDKSIRQRIEFARRKGLLSVPA